ncbi:MAG TPA: YbaN family protein [Longimicrobiales bacterium]|nr:YbaN family protein [Longimicrobiales bacterium]
MTARWPFAILAYLFAALALLGVVVPGLPTTPFVLLAAWSASRGSRRLHDWLVQHPRLGPPLAHWREQRAVSTRAKLLAISFLAASWLIMAWRGMPGPVLIALGALFIVVATFVATRPRPSPHR